MNQKCQISINVQIRSNIYWEWVIAGYITLGKTVPSGACLTWCLYNIITQYQI